MRFTKGSKIIATKKERKRKDERERKQDKGETDRMTDRQTEREGKGNKCLPFQKNTFVIVDYV